MYAGKLALWETEFGVGKLEQSRQPPAKSTHRKWRAHNSRGNPGLGSKENTMDVVINLRPMSQILLVDDNAIQAATRKAILARAGRRVLVAESGAVALNMLADETLTSQIALVITDHLMPGMNGPELVKKLRELLPDTPVVVLSGLPDAESEYEAENVEFHLKPIAPEVLIRVVGELLDGSVAQTA